MNKKINFYFYSYSNKWYTTIHDIIPMVMDNFHILYKAKYENFYKLIKSINKKDIYFSVS